MSQKRPMKNICIFLLLILAASTAADAQYSRQVIQLRDKKSTEYSLSQPQAFLSARAIKRRTVQHINIDSTDLPVPTAYLDSIRLVPGVTILNTSKWLNQVLVQITDANALTKINQFPFVFTTSPVAPIARPITEIINRKINDSVFDVSQRARVSGIRQQTGANDFLSYGNTFNQIHIHEGEYLHNLGFTGNGVVIAILDAGFKYFDTNPALDSVRLQNHLLGGYDFVLNIPQISQDHQHGATCFTVIASNRPGVLVGSAPAASFWLLRSEDAASEYPVEEQNWAAAAEFADSVGADMISTSLGYTSYDDPTLSHPYADRDGNTCMITKAADMAAKKGMIVTSSAGNNGGLASDEKYVACPADGDSVLAVGAIKADKTIAAFSSWGPSASGKVKPNVVSIGEGTAVANAMGNASFGNGTSFSNPNLAGLIACLWQAFPEFTNMEIIDAVQKSSDRYNNPDNRFGYGIPNFRVAYEMLLKERTERNVQTILGNKWLKVYPVPFDQEISVIIKAPVSGKSSIKLMDALGQTLRVITIDMVQDQTYVNRFTVPKTLSRGVYFIQYRDNSNTQTIRLIKK
jgi:serine protease AprX